MLQDLFLHISDESFKVAPYLPESIDLYANQFDQVQKSELRTAFNLAFRTDQHYFDWLYSPDNFSRYGERFGRAMMGMSLAVAGNLLDYYDWNQFEPGDKIVDVGGGVGHIAVLVKKKVKPGVHVVVQDLPAVVKQGRAIPKHNDVVEFQDHDFFTQQPIVSAQVYYFRYIMHDWPDRICQTILSHIEKVMTSESKLLIFDSVWPSGEIWASGKDDKTIIENYTWQKRFDLIRNMQMMSLLGTDQIQCLSQDLF